MEIVWFERIMIATLVLGLINSWLSLPHLSAVLSPSVLIFAQLFAVIVTLALTLLVSRRRSTIAKWLAIALFLLGVPLWFRQVTAGALPGSPFLGIVQTVAQFGAYALLFTPGALAWFRIDDART